MSGGTANPVLPQVFDAAVEDARVLASELEHADVRHAYALTHYDLALVALNVFCPDTNAALPPLPRTSPGMEDPILVTRDSNPLLFLHLLMAVNRHPQLRHMMPSVLEQGAMSCSPRAIREYGRSLLAAAKHVAENPERYRSRLARIVSAIAATDIANGLSPVAALQSMLSVDHRDGNELKFLVSSSRAALTAQVEAGDVCFIPGAGYNALTQLQRLKSTPLQFVLNDNNMFVGEVLSQTAQLLGASNVRVEQGDFRESDLQPGSVGSMVLSLVHVAGEEALDGLLRQAQTFMREGGTVVVYHPWRTGDETEFVSPTHFGQLLEMNGFEVVEHSMHPYLVHGSAGRKDHRPLYQLTFKEALDRGSAAAVGIPAEAHVFVARKPTRAALQT